MGRGVVQDEHGRCFRRAVQHAYTTPAGPVCDLLTIADGQVTQAKNNDTKLHLPGFPMNDIRFLSDNPTIDGSETCFSDWAIEADESLELLFSAPKRRPGFLGFNYWFDGLSREGNPTLYRLVMDGAFTSGEENWIGDATATFSGWRINGQVDVNGDTACAGEGLTNTTIMIDEVS